MRQQLIDTIVARLKTITVLNGYNTNIYENVSAWRMGTISPDDLPSIEVRDLDAIMTDEDLDGTTGHALNFEAYILCAGASAAADARAGIADIAKALNTDPTFGGIVKLFNVTGHSLAMQQAEENLVVGTYEFNLYYWTGPGEI